jgi:hypothetical protein
VRARGGEDRNALYCAVSAALRAEGVGLGKARAKGGANGAPRVESAP